MKRILGIVLATVFLSVPVLRANEGMWLPMFIERLNHRDMQKLGLQLTPEEIYSVNNSSLKDAIVMLSGGMCTAEAISSEGLLLTNHHCAFNAIQENSSVNHDYLTDGFWAMDRAQELRAEGMTASFLIRMEDVSEVINTALEGASGDERDEIIRTLSDSIQEAATEDTHYNARVKSFFEGNEFYLFVYETFKDVRLVGAPPSSIGKYGGDTDNWMWPRHTGDFALLRVYAGRDGKPAAYADDNIAMKPRHHLPVSLDGVAKNDFAMIMGYPGSTDRYLTSYGVNMAITKDQPARVKLRGARLDIWKESMNASPAVRIQYASKYASVSNYWKYFIGQTEQVKKNGVYDKKVAEEKAYRTWANANAERKEKYGDALDMIEAGYVELDEYILASTYFQEAVFASEVLLMGYRLMQLRGALNAEPQNPIVLNAAIQTAKGQAQEFYKNYNGPTDKRATAALLKMYYEDIPADLQPQLFRDMVKKSKGDFDRLANTIFGKSMVPDSTKLYEFLVEPSAKKMDKDPVVQLAGAFLGKFRNDVGPKLQGAYAKIDEGNRLYVDGLRQVYPDRNFYPNANSTMRLTYGRVLDYTPRDAVKYNYFTTLEGVMQKEDPNNDEFIVPAKLKELYEAEDYGQYADKDGTMHVCFVTDNDITGGNSGSPVINAKGELIGCAFDGNWEAMSGDIFFEDQIQRTIVVDIRYVLFVIDKFAGAGHLVKEMTLAKSAPPQAASAPKVMPEAVEQN